jgi:DNA-binding LacI/PurR family transcriptional regulator
MREVAAEAGVSLATVSRVLAGSADVAPELAGRVKLVAKALGYHPNAAARGLRTGRSLTVGLVVPDIQNPFFTSVMSGLEDVLRAGNYSLFLANAAEDVERERLHLQRLLADGAAGVLFVPVAPPEVHYHYLRAAGIPVVTLSRDHPQLNADSVTVDNTAGVQGAVRHLIGLGHRRIAFINGPVFRSTSRERLAGYEQALREAAIPIEPELIRISDFRQAGGFESMRALLAMGDRPTAVMSGNNMMTLGALEAIHSGGVRVPDEIALVGFDDMPWATSLKPSLTAVAQPTFEIGRTAAQLLLDRLQDPELPVRHIVLETTLHVRASCGAGPADRTAC